MAAQPVPDQQWVCMFTAPRTGQVLFLPVKVTDYEQRVQDEGNNKPEADRDGRAREVRKNVTQVL